VTWFILLFVFTFGLTRAALVPLHVLALTLAVGQNVPATGDRGEEFRRHQCSEGKYSV
jgi:hypothetical protein